MTRRLRARSLVLALTASTLVLAGCNVAPPTGQPPGEKPVEPTRTHPAPTAISCATMESELAFINERVSEAAANFGDDPYATLDRMRDAIDYIEELRDVAEDISLQQKLNEIAVEANALVDTIDRVMRNGTILAEFDQISKGADEVEERLNDLIDYCRF